MSLRLSPHFISLCRSDWVISIIISASSTVGSFFCPSVLLLSPFTHWIYISVVVFFNCKFLFDSFWLRFLIFSFVSSVLIIACWSIFMMATLKSLLGNLDIFIILVLAPVGFLFCIQFGISWFFVWSVIFQMKLGCVCITLWDFEVFLDLLFYLLSLTPLWQRRRWVLQPLYS